MSDYDAACARAATEQGLDPLTARLRAANMTHGVEQTGGMTMAVTVRSRYGTWAFIQEGPGTEHLPPSYRCAFYADEDWTEGGEPLHTSVTTAQSIVEHLAAEQDEYPFLPGEHVTALGQPARISWINSAPRRGFYWIGYKRGTAVYAGLHVDREGYDQKGRLCFEKNPEANA